MTWRSKVKSGLFLSVCLVQICLSRPARAEPKGVPIPGMDFLVRLVMDYLDTNNDAVLDRGEFQDGSGRGFGELDRDGDGIITPKEMEAMAEQLAAEDGASLLVAKAAGFLLRGALLSMDNNKDGQVSREEFSAGCEAIFEKLDADHDGKVSKEELMALPVRLLGM